MIAVFHAVPAVGNSVAERLKIKYGRNSNFSCKPIKVKNGIFLDAEIKIPMNATEKQRKYKIKYAMKKLSDMGVHRLAADIVFEAFANYEDMSLVRTDAAWRAVADKGAIVAIEKSGESVKSSCIKISAERITGEIAKAANSLAICARYIVIDECPGAENLREILYLNYGVAKLKQPPIGVYTYNMQAHQKPIGLHLQTPKWAEKLRPPCISAEVFTAVLYEMGAISAEEIEVVL